MRFDKLYNQNSGFSAVNTTERKLKVVLAGNPNVGKSLIFNYLSGMYVDVSNFPGTTISVSKGYFSNYEIYDTPGIYGVSSFNDEEKVARDIILEADTIINVVNSLHLERDLFLTQQLIDMGKKVAVILNFSDEVKKRNIKINSQKLSVMLGVEVIETSALNSTGFENIGGLIKRARKGKQQLSLHFLLQQVIEKGLSQAESLLVLEGDEDLANKFNLPKGTPDEREKIYIERRNRVNEIVDCVEHENTSKGKFLNKLGRLALHPSTGVPLLAIVLVALYFFIGDLISQRVVGFTENTIGIEIFEYNLKSFVANYANSTIDVELMDEDGSLVETKSFNFPDGKNADQQSSDEFSEYSNRDGASSNFIFHNPLLSLFFGEFGVVTMTITYLVFLLLPLVIGFYFVMALLEDSGYLPRLATMLDRTFTRIGLNGRAVIPIMLGFGCITMANITTRLLGTEREKSIVTAILQFVIPCSAQLAVITVLLSGAGLLPLLIYVTVIFTVLISLSTILNKMMKGESSPLLIDLPVMQIPKMNNVIKKTLFRSYGFMKEAGLYFFIGALAIGILQITGLLTIWQNILEPLTTGWLKLPAETSTAFVMGMVRRDFGAAGLFGMDLTTMQITVALITITLFVPCIASFVVMIKERGWREGLTVWFGTWITAFLIGGIVAQIMI